MGHFAFRTTSPEALERRAAILEKAGFGVGWTDGDLGHGKTFAFKSSDGHPMEIYYETEWYKAPDHLKPSLKNQAMRFPARGVNVRRLDHLNLLADDVPGLKAFFEDALGLRTTEMIVLDSGELAGVWVTATNKTYDVAFTHDHYGAVGRFITPPRARLARGDPARRRHLSRERHPHRDRAAQARRAADVLPLRLRAGRQPRRGGQRRRASHARARLAAGRVDRDRAQEGPGVGPQDDRDLPHPRHADDGPHTATGLRCIRRSGI
jgi:catechol 2,3-dioxygenase-like lactoylglutathione lyase family enzyme